MLRLNGTFAVPAAEEIEEYYGWDSYVQLCGSRLSDMLSAVCQGQYNEDNSTPPGYIEKRIQEGPATNCCQKLCKIRQMKDYCLDSRVTGKYFIWRKKVKPTLVAPHKSVNQLFNAL